jgi:hypothetical protein
VLSPILARGAEPKLGAKHRAPTKGPIFAITGETIVVSSKNINNHDVEEKNLSTRAA